MSIFCIVHGMYWCFLVWGRSLSSLTHTQKARPPPHTSLGVGGGSADHSGHVHLAGSSSCTSSCCWG
jgi:hypothetical protein